MLTYIPSPKHKPGVTVSDEDRAPEFHAETLPAGSAPADRTFKPNPESETPGQADNENSLRSHGKESTHTSALDTLGGTDSGAVHTGLGHPGSGQTSSELRNEGQSGLKGQETGGSGMSGDQNAEARRLARDTTEHGPSSGREHNTNMEGAQDKI